MFDNWIARNAICAFLSRTRNRSNELALQQGFSAESDKRQAQRRQADYILEYRVAGRDKGGVGRALDHSETGMRFLANQPLVPGSYVTVRVSMQSQAVPILTCLANVVRCLTLPDGRSYAVGCAYD